MTKLDLTLKKADECPNCGSDTDHEDEMRFCDHCGWDEAPYCPHWISKRDWCSQCPHGGV